MELLFEVHKLNERGLSQARQMAQRFQDLLDFLETPCLPGRDLEIAKAKLQEACFFAKRAMAMNPENQEPQVKSA